MKSPILIFRLVFCSVFWLVLPACVYGPSTEHKSSLDVLNGKNYDTSPMGTDNVILPIIKTKDRQTHVAGKIVYSEGLVEVPLKFVHVSLLTPDNRALTEASTDAQGEFTLIGVFPNGQYRLLLTADGWSGEKPLVINDYDIKGIVIAAQRPGVK